MLRGTRMLLGADATRLNDLSISLRGSLHQ